LQAASRLRNKVFSVGCVNEFPPLTNSLILRPSCQPHGILKTGGATRTFKRRPHTPPLLLDDSGTKNACCLHYMGRYKATCFDLTSPLGRVSQVGQLQKGLDVSPKTCQKPLILRLGCCNIDQLVGPGPPSEHA